MGSFTRLYQRPRILFPCPTKITFHNNKKQHGIQTLKHTILLLLFTGLAQLTQACETPIFPFNIVCVSSFVTNPYIVATFRPSNMLCLLLFRHLSEHTSFFHFLVYVFALSIDFASHMYICKASPNEN
jgi:hypothetical protein